MRKTLLVGLLILAACGLAYGNVFWNEFTKWDDEWLIFENPYIFELTADNLLAIFDVTIDRHFLGEEYLPVRDVSWLVDHLFFEGNPVGFHLADLLLHALNSLAVFVLVRQLLPGASRVAFFTALLFAVHPVHTESVTWMSSRKDVLSGFFVLFGLVVAGAPVRRRNEGRDPEGELPGWGRMAFVLGCFAMAVLSKSTAIVFPLLLVLQDLALGRVGRSGKTRILWGGRLIPFFALAVVMVGVVRMTSGESGLRVAGYHGGSLLATLWIQSKAFLDYVSILLFPVVLRTGVVIPKVVVYDLAHLIAAVVVTGLAGIALVWGIQKFFGGEAARRASESGGQRGRFSGWGGFCAAWFLVCLLPVSNLIPMNWIYCERYLYLPSVGFCLALGLGVSEIVRVGEKRGARFASRLVVGLFAVLVLLFTVRTHLRNRDWRTNLDLWTVTAQNDPENVDVLFSYSKALEGKRRFAEAIEQYEALLAKNPGRSDARLNLSHLLIKTEDPERLDQAETVLREGAKIDPENAHLYNNLAYLYRSRGDVRQALEAYREATLRDPVFRGAWAELLFLVRRLDRAREQIDLAIRETPGNAGLYGVSARIFLGNGEASEAMRAVDCGLELSPRSKELIALKKEIGDALAGRDEGRP